MPHVCRLSDITAANHVAPNIITLIIIAPQVLPDVATADLHEDIGQMAKKGVEETVAHNSSYARPFIPRCLNSVYDIFFTSSLVHLTNEILKVNNCLFDIV